MHGNRNHSHAFHSEWNGRMSKQKQHKRLPLTPWKHLPHQMPLERTRRWEASIVTLCSIWNLLEQLLTTKVLFVHRKSWFVSEWENALIPSHDEGKKDVQLPPTTITTNSSHSIRVEERDNWFVTEWSVTTIYLECPLKCDSDEHTARYQREWRKDNPQRFLLLHNEVLEITEWEMYGFQVVLENELDRLFQWFYKQWLRLKWEWSLCGWLHWCDGLSNDDE